MVQAVVSDGIKTRGERKIMLGGCILALAGHIMLLIGKNPVVKYRVTAWMVFTSALEGRPAITAFLPRCLGSVTWYKVLG